MIVRSSWTIGTLRATAIVAEKARAKTSQLPRTILLPAKPTSNKNKKKKKKKRKKKEREKENGKSNVCKWGQRILTNLMSSRIWCEWRATIERRGRGDRFEKKKKEKRKKKNSKFNPTVPERWRNVWPGTKRVVARLGWAKRNKNAVFVAESARETFLSSGNSLRGCAERIPLITRSRLPSILPSSLLPVSSLSPFPPDPFSFESFHRCNVCCVVDLTKSESRWSRVLD